MSLAAGAAFADGGNHAIVVLGKGLDDDGSIPSELEWRLEAALRASAAHPSALLIVTGGAVKNEHPEGPAMARWFRKRGVAQSRIRVEAEARHTLDNADKVLPILVAENVARVTVVTARSHLPRALYHFRSALRERGLRRMTRVDGLPAEDGMRGLRALGAIARERYSIVRDAAYRVRNRSRARRPLHRGERVRGK